MANEPKKYIDPRTRRPINSRQAYGEVPTRPVDDRKRQTAIAFGHLVKTDAYRQMKKLASSLAMSKYPEDLNTAISWLFAQGRRSGFDLLFGTIENLARSVEPEDQEPLDGMRESLFAEHDFLDLD